MEMLSPHEVYAFMVHSDTERPTTIRINTLKAKRKEVAKSLISKGVDLDPVGTWDTEGLKIYKSSISIGATLEYLSGQYMLQACSSWLPVLALDPKPYDNVLDMCAAPGGKSAHIGSRMQNVGQL